ncbi:hypothetical protein V9T40_014150 [Parthenolecanium corni]|uniref:Uncharacterized protein n=1 Tax=Parthenolecanium corni TaxID=536013 RepID=A0AAN9TCE2_9HEMI
MPAIYGPSSGNCCKKRRYKTVYALRCTVVVGSPSSSVVVPHGPVRFRRFSVVVKTDHAFVVYGPQNRVQQVRRARKQKEQRRREERGEKRARSPCEVTISSVRRSAERFSSPPSSWPVHNGANTSGSSPRTPSPTFTLDPAASFVSLYARGCVRVNLPLARSVEYVPGMRKKATNVGAGASFDTSKTTDGRRRRRRRRRRASFGGESFPFFARCLVSRFHPPLSSFCCSSPPSFYTSAVPANRSAAAATLLKMPLRPPPALCAICFSSARSAGRVVEVELSSVRESYEGACSD